MTRSKQVKYDLRFKSFLRLIDAVSKLDPQDKYLYPIMDGVPFRDLEVALDIAILEAVKCETNDLRSAKNQARPL